MSDSLSPASIRARARVAGLELDTAAGDLLARHASEVLSHNASLHLTTVTEPAAFLERHLGESFEGVALLRELGRGAEARERVLLDLGSGNGYPALPVAIADGGLRPLLTEANRRKAEFLARCVAGVVGAAVIHRQVQRPSDLDGIERVDVLTTRAMGAWEKVVPRFASSLDRSGAMLIWAGAEVDKVARRAAWGKLRVLGRRPLPGRERSWIWALARAS